MRRQILRVAVEHADRGGVVDGNERMVERRERAHLFLEPRGRVIERETLVLRRGEGDHSEADDEHEELSNRPRPGLMQRRGAAAARWAHLGSLRWCAEAAAAGRDETIVEWATSSSPAPNSILLGRPLFVAAVAEVAVFEASAP